MDNVKVDDDLGRCNKKGFTNNHKLGDEKRVFGLKTIRDDKPKHKFESIACPYNFGD